MANLNLVIPGADFSGTGIGKFVPLPSMGGALYAGYLLGNEFFASQRLPGTAASDLSGNGRDLVFVGPGAGAFGLPASPENYAVLPFSAADLWAIKGGATMISVCSVQANQNLTLVGNIDITDSPADPKSVALVTSTGSSAATFFNHNQSLISVPTGGVERDPSRLEMLAGTQSGTTIAAYRRRRSFEGSAYASGGNAGVVDSDENLLIGRTVDGGPPFDGAGTVHAVLLATRALTQSELDLVYLDLRDLFDSFGMEL